MKEFIYLPKAIALFEKFFFKKPLLLSFVALLFAVYPKYSMAGHNNLRPSLYLQEFAQDSVALKFDNRFAVPVSIRLELELDNLNHNTDNNITAVIPAGKQGFTLANFKRIRKDLSYKCSYNWKVVLGDVTKQPDLTFSYALPYKKTGKFKVSQGPHGNISHQDMFAYDFAMPAGTPVTAARDGVVAFVKSDSDKGGPDRKFLTDANYISVYHEDGTMGNYFHLKKNGAAVKEGQIVKKGEVIGYSGNTGFSNGPHLHFEIIQPSLDTDKNRSVVFNWADDRSDLAKILNQKEQQDLFSKQL